MNDIIQFNKLPKCLNKIIFNYWSPKKEINKELLEIFKNKNKQKKFILRILLTRIYFLNIRLSADLLLFLRHIKNHEIFSFLFFDSISIYNLKKLYKSYLRFKNESKNPLQIDLNKFCDYKKKDCGRGYYVTMYGDRDYF